nr:hypothetical protein [Streptomyces pacificus]
MAFRSDFGAGFLRSPSLDGGLDELCESAATCRSSSAIRSACTVIVSACADTSSFNSTISAARSSYEGCGGGVEDTRSTYPTPTITLHHATADHAQP